MTDEPVRRSLRPLLASTGFRIGALALAAAATTPLWLGAGHADQPAPAAKSRTLGFVITGISRDMKEYPEACPKGMNKSPQELYAASLTEEERKALTSGTAAQRQGGFRKSAMNKNGKLMCLDPTGDVADWAKTPILTVQGHGLAAGLNLDGRISRPGGPAPANGCAHEEFVNDQGERGVDNQFFRVGGCIKGFRNDAMTNKMTFGSEIRQGAWALLVDVEGVDDTQNDPDVTVGIYASQDPAPFAASITPVPNRSLSIDTNRQYWAQGKGRIVNGVLTSDAMDVKFRVTAQVNTGSAGKDHYPPREVYLRGARIRLTLQKNGNAEGVLAGYQDLASYDTNFIAFLGDTASSLGSSSISAYSCPALRAALQQYADGYRDPATGQCTAISTAYTIQAIPAFVIKGGVGSGVEVTR